MTQSRNLEAWEITELTSGSKFVSLTDWGVKASSLSSRLDKEQLKLSYTKNTLSLNDHMDLKNDKVYESNQPAPDECKEVDEEYGWLAPLVNESCSKAYYMGL